MSLLGGNFNFLASLCSRGDWFEIHFFGNLEDEFYRDNAHLAGSKNEFLPKCVYTNLPQLLLQTGEKQKNMGCDTTKPVFGVSNKVRFKLACSATGTS